MRRASTTPTLAIVICLSLGVLVPAAPAAAAPPRPASGFGFLWANLESGLDWLWGWVGPGGEKPTERETRRDGVCSDPHGGTPPPGQTCPPPSPSSLAGDPNSLPKKE